MKILHKGIPIKEGDTISSFRGEDWEYQYLSSGNNKVVVKGPIGSPSPSIREFFIHVFDLVMQE